MNQANSVSISLLYVPRVAMIRIYLFVTGQWQGDLKKCRQTVIWVVWKLTAFAALWVCGSVCLHFLGDWCQGLLLGKIIWVACLLASALPKWYPDLVQTFPRQLGPWLGEPMSLTSQWNQVARRVSSLICLEFGVFWFVFQQTLGKLPS